MFSVCPMLPRNSVDLLIADPPYNLTKSFSSTRFAKVSKTEYENYTRRWISAVTPLLKETASIYICCDWESSLIIGRILPDFFCVRNRITWQREKGRGAKANWKNSMEDIWFATTGNSYTFNLDAVKIRKRVIAPYHTGGQPKGWEQTDLGRYRDTCPSNFWDDITIPFWSMPENTAHPTQKPRWCSIWPVSWIWNDKRYCKKTWKTIYWYRKRKTVLYLGRTTPWTSRTQYWHTRIPQRDFFWPEYFIRKPAINLTISSKNNTYRICVFFWTNPVFSAADRHGNTFSGNTNRNILVYLHPVRFRIIFQNYACPIQRQEQIAPYFICI